MDSFTRDGLRFDVADTGPADGDVVVLLHGFPQHASCWTAVTRLLNGAGLRTLAPDQRGYSPRARPQGRAAYRVREMVADTVALVEAAGAGRVHLVGHDWGAGVAWATAAARPDLLTGLTALSVPHPAAFLRALGTSSQGLRSWYMGALQVRGLAERLLDPAHPGGRERFVRLLRSTGQTPERARRDADFLSVPGAFTAAVGWYRALVLEDPRSFREPVRVPTTMVWSDADSAISRAGVERTRDWVAADYRLQVLPGVGHWIPEEAPGAVAEAVLTALPG